MHRVPADPPGRMSPPLLRTHRRGKTNIPLRSPLLAQGIAPHHSGFRDPNRFRPHRSLFRGRPFWFVAGRWHRGLRWDRPCRAVLGRLHAHGTGQWWLAPGHYW